eukprot:2991852-Prymnesium_polylepis.1
MASNEDKLTAARHATQTGFGSRHYMVFGRCFIKPQDLTAAPLGFSVPIEADPASQNVHACAYAAAALGWRMLLPAGQFGDCDCQELHGLWREFELAATDKALRVFAEGSVMQHITGSEGNEDDLIVTPTLDPAIVYYEPAFSAPSSRLLLPSTRRFAEHSAPVPAAFVSVRVWKPPHLHPSAKKRSWRGSHPSRQFCGIEHGRLKLLRSATEAGSAPTAALLPFRLDPPPGPFDPLAASVCPPPDLIAATKGCVRVQ